jgi:hypothetical protein
MTAKTEQEDIFSRANKLRIIVFIVAGVRGKITIEGRASSRRTGPCSEAATLLAMTIKNRRQPR